MTGPHPCFYRGIPTAVAICGACERDLAREGMTDCQRCAERRLRRERSALAVRRMQAGRFWDGLPQGIPAQCSPPGSMQRSAARSIADPQRRRDITWRIFACTVIGGMLACLWGFVWAVIR